MGDRINNISDTCYMPSIEELKTMPTSKISNLFYRLYRRSPNLEEIDFAKENGYLKLLAPMENKEKTNYKITKNSIRQEKYLEAVEIYKRKEKERASQIRVRDKRRLARENFVQEKSTVITYNKFFIKKVTNEIVEINNKARKEAVLKYHKDNKIMIPSNMLKVLNKY